MLSFTVSISQTPRIMFTNAENIINIKAPKNFNFRSDLNRIFDLSSIIKQIFSLFNSFAIQQILSIPNYK